MQAVHARCHYNFTYLQSITWKPARDQSRCAQAASLICSRHRIFDVFVESRLSYGLSSRRSFLLATVGVLTEASLAATEPTQHRVSIALAARQSLYHLPLTLADQLGFFRQIGLAVDWLPHEGGAKALATATQGQADVFAGAFEHLFGLYQRGVNYQGFVQLGRTPQLALGVSTRKGAALRSVMELKGTRIGISALDSGTYWIAALWTFAGRCGVYRSWYVLWCDGCPAQWGD